MMSLPGLAGLFVVCCLLWAFPAQAFAGEEREDCAVCGMWIDLYMRTRHVVTLEDSTSASFCSIACTAKYMKRHHGKVKDVKAADYLTRELVDAGEAFYLEGSDVPGVMSYTSRIAFSAKEEAEKFRREHGGRIVTFTEALEGCDDQ